MTKNSVVRAANMQASVGNAIVPVVDPIRPESRRSMGIERNPDAGIVPVSNIHPDPGQPRKDFDPEYIARLAESIAENGMLHPIAVREHSTPGHWWVVVGECRLRAAVLAGIGRVPCTRIELANQADVAILQLIENCNRRDLNDVEKAEAYEALMRSKSWNQKQLARHLHTSESQVCKVLTILKADEYTKADIVSGRLGIKDAYQKSVARKEEREGRTRQSRMTERTYAEIVDTPDAAYSVTFELKVRKANVPEEVFLRAIAQLARKEAKTHLKV